MNVNRKLAYLPVLLLLFFFALPASALHFSSARIFTASNEASGNRVLMFAHHPFSGLHAIGSANTGGLGTGSGLGNQGAVTISEDGRWLLVVNAGSDDISVFRLHKVGISLVGTFSSNGQQPISVTEHGGVVYALNAASDSIAGFYLENNGQLSPIANSIQSLSGAGTGSAQISFSPWGDSLVVTEKATNLITTFAVGDDDAAAPGVSNLSAGPTPFGFGFDRYGHLLVTEAAGGAPDSSSVSSYDIQEDGTLSLLDGPVPSTETAACWLATSRNGRVAFVTNTGSSTITALKVFRNGSLQLTSPDGVAASTGAGSAPIDLALSDSGRYLFALSANVGEIAAFRVIGNKHLVPLTSIDGLPTTSNGMAVD